MLYAKTSLHLNHDGNFVTLIKIHNSECYITSQQIYTVSKKRPTFDLL